MIEIEKDVPLPHGRHKYPFDEMAVGDSFFAEKVKAKSLRSIAWRHRPKQFTIRKEEEGVRCWRVG
jgi:hypothetical protein